MPAFSSNEELFNYALDLIDRIKSTDDEAAEILCDGFGCLNGLTDGWTEFIVSLKEVSSNHKHRLQETDLTDLEELLSVVSNIVSRS